MTTFAVNFLASDQRETAFPLYLPIPLSKTTCSAVPPFAVAIGTHFYVQKRRSVPEKSTRIRNPGPHATFHQTTIQNSQASHPFAIVVKLG